MNRDIQAATICKRFLKSSKWSTFSPTTQTKYMGYIQKFLTWVGNRAYRNLEFYHFEEDFLKSQRKNPTNHNDMIACFHSIFAWAVKKRLITQNIMDYVSRVKIPDADLQAFTEHDFEKWRAKYPSGTLESLAVHIMYYTSMRQSDLRNLTMENFADGWVRYKTVKTNVPVDFPIPPRLAEELNYWAHHQGRFFLNRKNEPMTSRQFCDWWRYRAQKIGSSKSAHTLRRGAVCRLINNDADRAGIKTITGHKNLEMINHYGAQYDRLRLAEITAKLL